MEIQVYEGCKEGMYKYHYRDTIVRKIKEAKQNKTVTLKVEKFSRDLPGNELIDEIYEIGKSTKILILTRSLPSGSNLHQISEEELKQIAQDLRNQKGIEVTVNE